MATVKTSATCAADSNFAITATFAVWEGDSDVSKNESTVWYRLIVSGSGTQNYRFSGHSRSHAGWVYCAVNGTVVYSGYTGLPNGFTNGTTLIDTGNKSVTVTHNSDGKKTCGFYVDLDSSDDDYGHINWKFNDGNRANGSIELTTIARASQPSMNTWPNNSENVTAGVQCYVHMNRKSSSFTHKVYYTWKQADVHRTAGLAKTSGITDNVAFTPPVDLCQDFPNAKTGWGTMWVETYNGSTLIGTKSCKFTVNLPFDAQPTISADYKETGTLADGKTLLTDKGVNDSTCIALLSKKVITVTASAKYYSTIKQIICKHGGNTQSSTNNPATFTFQESEYGNSGDYEWSAVDSRGNTVTGSVRMNFVFYSKPVVSTIRPSRDSNVVDTGKLSIDGIYFNSSIGNITNDIYLVVDYAGKTIGLPSSAIVKSEDHNSKSWQVNDYAINGVDPGNAYKFTVTVTDSIGYSTSKDVILPQADPTLWLGKRTVRVNDYLMVNKALMVNGQSVVGLKIAAFTIDVVPSRVTNNGGVIVDAKTTQNYINQNCPEGYEFLAIIGCSCVGWVGIAYPQYPNTDGTNIYGRSISGSPSTAGAYLVVLYQTATKADDSNTNE